jgi:hypothetical protein
MADPTFSNTQIEQDDDSFSNDFTMVTDDALHEGGIPVDHDNLPVPTMGDQGNDQDWESNYAMEDRATETLLTAPQSAPHQVVASANNTGTMDSIPESIFNVADDSMADVTANPWTTSL